MFRGVDVSRHGITTNVFQPLARPVPSFFDLAHEHGLLTGMFFNWAELRDLMAPASAKISYLYNDAYSARGDAIVAEAACKHLDEYDFDLLFVYLGFTDECAHEQGWMSEPYLQAISHADECIERVLEAFGPHRPNVLVTSDHGGHGRSHGTDCDEDMTIPLVLNGPSIREAHVLDCEVRIYDVCPTVAALAGLPAHRYWEGRVIREAFLRPEDGLL
jgi:hypothetical protein